MPRKNNNAKGVNCNFEKSQRDWLEYMLMEVNPDARKQKKGRNTKGSNGKKFKPYNAAKKFVRRNDSKRKRQPGENREDSGPDTREC